MGLSPEELLNLPEDCAKVDVPINSPQYQNFLAAVKQIEDQREQDGIPSADAFANLQTTVAEATKFGLELKAGDRSSGR